MSTKEYQEDKKLTRVRIFYLYPFLFAPWTTNTILQSPGYSFGDLMIKNENGTGHQFIILEREISSKLLKKIKKNPEDGEVYLRGYLTHALNLVNNFLISGILEFSFFGVHLPSQLNLGLIGVNSIKGKPLAQIITKQGLGVFPFSKDFTGINDEYRLELMLAMKSFFDSNLNESIRRLYSSVDAFCNIKGLKTNVDTLKKVLNVGSGKIVPVTVFDNMKIGFQWRGYIVHEGKTIDYEKGFYLVYRLIRTFCYFYRIADPSNQRYFLELEGQFMKYKHDFTGINLDFDVQLKSFKHNGFDERNNIIRKEPIEQSEIEDVNNWFMDCIRINKNESAFPG